MSSSLYLNCFITFYVHTSKTAEHCVKGNKQVSLELVLKIFLPLAFLLMLFLQVYPAKKQLWKIKKATDKIIHLLLTLSLLWHASSENCELKFQAVSILQTSKKAQKNHAGCQQLSWLLVGLWRDVLQLAPRVNLGSPRHKVVAPTQPFVLSSHTKRRRRHLHFNYKLEYISLVLFFIAVTEPVIF